jgi:hypothetical protein
MATYITLLLSHCASHQGNVAFDGESSRSLAQPTHTTASHLSLSTTAGSNDYPKGAYRDQSVEHPPTVGLGKIKKLYGRVGHLVPLLGRKVKMQCSTHAFNASGLAWFSGAVSPCSPSVDSPFQGRPELHTGQPTLPWQKPQILYQAEAIA